MLGSSWGATLVVVVGEAEVVDGAAVVVGVELGVLEREASGLPSPLHPASSTIAIASGTARIAVEVFFVLLTNFTESPTVRRTERA
jgi:hypothetical protein